ncbi:MAG TPA: DUF3472 domain-containing protein [Magnetospirillum sp.]|nr:DUF3472 domain-containing protein [Magnetospirillum sp.]
MTCHTLAPRTCGAVLACLLCILGMALPPLAMAEEALTLRNVWKGTFLTAGPDGPSVARNADGAVWTIEQTSIAGAVRLRHPAGGYLNVEKDARYPVVGNVGPGWQSAMWFLEPVAGTDRVRIRNVWRKSYLHIEHGTVETGEVGPGWLSAQWNRADVAPSGPPPVAADGFTSILLGGNAYLSNRGAGGAAIAAEGLKAWQDDSVTATVYVRTMSAGRRSLHLIARSGGPAVVEVTVGGRRTNVTIDGTGWRRYDAGTFQFAEGYQAIVLRAVDKQGFAFPDITAVEIEGAPSEFRYVTDQLKPGSDAPWRNSAAAVLNFGRRGASGHLDYILPAGKDIEWFYSEITVPRGADLPGSYYEANGCSEGYFGFQVVGPDRRIVLFSIWASYATNNIKDVPEHLRIQVQGRGESVNAGDFGGEGSGGSSSMVFPWKAGLTYGFLTRVRPNDDGSTSYSAYFHDPEQDAWHYLATFRRPQTRKWYTGSYAFLENFLPYWGDADRRALYGNQWARDTEGRWHEITSAKYTVDTTGNRQERLDFQGGVSNGQFFLRGFGHFNEWTAPGTVLKRPPTGTPPQIDFSNLPRS